MALTEIIRAVGILGWAKYRIFLIAQKIEMPFPDYEMTGICLQRET